MMGREVELVTTEILDEVAVDATMELGFMEVVVNVVEEAEWGNVRTWSEGEM